MAHIDRERFGAGSLPIWVRHEHEARWRFASQFVAGKNVADCACGVGLGSALFAEAGALTVKAFDVSDDAVRTARENCARFPNVSVEQADGTRLPLDSSSIDLFVSFETIEHIDEDHKFLKEIARSLTTAGTFICSTPNRTITMPGKDISTKPWNPFHVREYDRAEFVALLEQYFDDVAIHGQNPKGIAFTAILAFVGKLFPGHIGGRLNSALKLPRFVHTNGRARRVTAMPDGGTCEYLVAVCNRKKVPQ